MASVHTAHATFYLDVSYLSYNQGGNYSTWNIHIHASADSGWGSGTFSSGTAWSSYGGSGTFNISGTSVEVANYNVNIGHDANGYLNWTITANVGNTGTSTYGTGVSWSASGSGPRIPKVPGAPSLTATAAPGLVVNLNVGIPAGYDEGGSSVQYLWTEYSKDGGAFTGGTSGGWGARSYTGLLPGSYVFRARAHNAIGDGPNTTAAAVQVLPGGYYFDKPSGTWKASLGVNYWDKPSSTWKPALGVYYWDKPTNTWKPAL